jgi:diguanylate cyclase (GGDEF)-like protein
MAMTAVDEMQPRDVGLAARLVFALTTVAAGVTVLFAVLAPDGTDVVVMVLTIAACLLMVAAAAVLQRSRRERRLAWAGFPFLAVAVIVTLDLVSRDASSSSQVFFFFPVLYGAAQLRRRGAIALTVAAVLGDLAVVFTLLTPRAAVVEGSYLTCALATTVALLVLAGERQDQLIAALRRQAAIDPLTGLVTRRVLDSAAHSALTGAASSLGTALILIDVDHFKAVNDEYGHPVGDEVLVQLAALLTRANRASDTVSRMGGDELAVLLAGCSLDQAGRRAEQLLWDVRAHDFQTPTGAHLSLTISVGLAHVPTHALDLRSLYAAADTSLYQAKRAGRDRVGAITAPLAETVDSG